MLLICVNAHLRAAEKGKGLGDGHDGNRSSISHVITLYDEKDVEIKPNVSQPRPISMRNTCGKCHDYDAMASGWHFHSGSTNACLLYTSPSPRDRQKSRMPSSA